VTVHFEANPSFKIFFGVPLIYKFPSLAIEHEEGKKPTKAVEE